MAEDPISEALDRLQRALDRLETVVTTPVAGPAPAPDGQDHKLRAEVQAVIAELDMMIGGRRG